METCSGQSNGSENSSNNRCWKRFLLRCHQPDRTPSWQPRWWNRVFPFPMFPTYRQSVQRLCIVLFFLLAWGILYAVLGETVVGLNGEILSMTLLVVSAYLVGWIWLKVTTLPALIGMLLTGILFQNLNLVHMTEDYRELNQDLRKVALVIILMRAGLGLDAKVLKRHWQAVLKLGLLPWLTECVAITVVSHYALHLPWMWGFLLGSMIASVSPAVVVPCLFRLRDEGYGEAKGIPTLLLAAAAIDDSVSVAVFSIILSALFSTGSITFNIIKGPLSIVAGIVLGSLWGAMTSVIPEKGDTYVVPLRFLILFMGGLFSLFISSMIGWSGAISTLDPQTMLMGAVVLTSCLVLRLIATLLVSFGCGLNFKEKLFIGLTWMAKATVQAALGPAALDLVSNGGTTGYPKKDELYYAKTLLAVSVLSVVISAPLGAILIALAGPKLLTRSKEPVQSTLTSTKMLASDDDTQIEDGLPKIP